MTLLNNKKHRTTVTRVFICITLVMVVLCLPFNVVAADLVGPSADYTVVLGSGSYDNYRGYEIAYPNDYRTYDASLYYASGMDRVRYLSRYDFLTLGENSYDTWKNKIVNQGYAVQFFRSDSKGGETLLPLCTGVKWGITSYATKIYRVGDQTQKEYAVFHAKLQTCYVNFVYRLYDPDPNDSDIYPQYTSTLTLTDEVLQKYISESDQFKQNGQIAMFNYNVDVDFGRPVMLERLEVRLVYQLYSDVYSLNFWGSIDQFGRTVFTSPAYDDEMRYYKQNLGFITDFGFPALKDWAKSKTLYQEFMTLGLNNNFVDFFINKYDPIDTVGPLTLDSSVSYSGGALAVIGTFFRRIIAYDMISALIGAVCTFSVVAAFIGVAVHFGRKK